MRLGRSIEYSKSDWITKYIIIILKLINSVNKYYMISMQRDIQICSSNLNPFLEYVDHINAG